MLLSAVTGKFLVQPTEDGNGQRFTLHSDSQRMSSKFSTVVVASQPQLPVQFPEVAIAPPRTH
jgi:hypothetical protein